MAVHPLFTTLKNLSGNARGIVFTEPLWGIPYNIYIPYASIYMLSFGLKDSQIGLIISIGMAVQIVAAMFSGVVADKLGRRQATFLCDLISWSIPCLIWAFAQNFTYFVVAAIFNGTWRMSMTAWTCLLVEDTEPSLLVDIYTWIYVSGLVAAFFAPLAGLVIQRYSLVPTMRGLYLLAFVMMTLKFVLMNNMVKETERGKARMHETRHQNLGDMLGEYGGVLSEVFHSPRMLYTAGLMVVFSITSMINGNFWAIIVTEKIHIPSWNLALFPFVRSIIMLGFYFLVIPRISQLPFKRPMLVGFCAYILSHMLLVFTPEKSYLLLVVSTLLEAGALATLNPFIDRMIALSISPKERARILALMYVMVILVSSPFGWIAGLLSNLNRAYPFLLTMALYAVGALLAVRASRPAVTEFQPVLEVE